MRRYPSILIGIAVAAFCLSVQAGPSGRVRSSRPALSVISTLTLPGEPSAFDLEREELYLGRAPDDETAAIIKYDLKSETQVWRTDTQLMFGGDDTIPIWVGEGIVLCVTVLAVTEMTQLFALRSSDGTILWREKDPDALSLSLGWSSSVVSDGRVYQNTDRGLRCVDAKTGAVLWKRLAGIGAVGVWPHAPVIAGDRLYAQLSNSHIVAVEAATGKLIWERPYFSDVAFDHAAHESGPIAVRGGYVYGVVPGGPQIMHDGGIRPGLVPGALYCWRAEDGAVVWKRPASWTDDPIVVQDGRVYVMANSRLVAYATGDGGQLWELNLRKRKKGGELGTWTVWGDYIFVELYRRRSALAVIDVQRGKVLTRRWLPRIDLINKVVVDDRRDRVLVTGLPKYRPAKSWNYTLSILELPAKPTH